MEIIKEITNKRSLSSTLNVQYKRGAVLSLDEQTQYNFKNPTYPLYLCKEVEPIKLFLRTTAELGLDDKQPSSSNDLKIKKAFYVVVKSLIVLTLLAISVAALI